MTKCSFVCSSCLAVIYISENEFALISSATFSHYNSRYTGTNRFAPTSFAKSKTHFAHLLFEIDNGAIYMLRWRQVKKFPANPENLAKNVTHTANPAVCLGRDKHYTKAVHFIANFLLNPPNCLVDSSCYDNLYLVA
jgi:hypothetical protein